jgi:hypothetical protein
MLAALGAALAMVGPGARCIDARLFGRKRVENSGILGKYSEQEVKRK